MGVIHTVLMLRFFNFRPPSPAIRAHTPLAYTLSSNLVHMYEYYFLKKSMTEIYFVNYCQLQNYKQRYKIKKLLCKFIRKC